MSENWDHGSEDDRRFMQGQAALTMLLEDLDT